MPDSDFFFDFVYFYQWCKNLFRNVLLLVVPGVCGSVVAAIEFEIKYCSKSDASIFERGCENIIYGLFLTFCI